MPSPLASCRVPALYHGTDLLSALALVRGVRISRRAAASRKIDGPPGFFLATSLTDAEFFAARRSFGATIEFRMSEEAVRVLKEAGAVLQPIAVTPRSPYFSGLELAVPPEAFAHLNSLRNRGEIDVGF
jgi:hypothetical protein